MESKSKKIILDEFQEKALSLINEGENVLVTGAAGTGKSTLLREIKAKYKNGFHLVASTGVAAVNIGGTTLHSWAALGLAANEAYTIASNIIAKRTDVHKKILKTKILAIDEVSMLDGGLIDKLDAIFRILRGNEDPFGGIQMLFMGDFLQLPPVNKEMFTQFAFESNSWIKANVKTVVLEKIYRQENEDFQECLNDLRMGIKSEKVKELFSSRNISYNKNDEIAPIILHTHNRYADTINEEKLEEIVGVSKTYESIDYFTSEFSKKLIENCLAPKELKLKVGAQVMLLVNIDVENGLANGSTGKVIGLLAKGVRVKFENGIDQLIEKNVWKVEENGKVISSRTQIPLRLAYAITIHKSQGMQFDKVKVFIAKCFEAGQAYVAISRVKTRDGLYLDTNNVNIVKANKIAVDFYSKKDKFDVNSIF